MMRANLKHHTYHPYHNVFHKLWLIPLVLLAFACSSVRAVEYIGLYITNTGLHAIASNNKGTQKQWHIEPYSSPEYAAHPPTFTTNTSTLRVFYDFLTDHGEELRTLFPTSSHATIHLYLAAAGYNTLKDLPNKEKFAYYIEHVPGCEEIFEKAINLVDFHKKMYKQMLKNRLGRDIKLTVGENDYSLIARMVANYPFSNFNKRTPIIAMQYTSMAQGSILQFGDTTDLEPMQIGMVTTHSGMYQIGASFGQKCKEAWCFHSEITPPKPGRESRPVIAGVLKSIGEDKKSPSRAAILDLLMQDTARDFSNAENRTDAPTQEGCIDFYGRIIRGFNSNVSGQVITHQFCTMVENPSKYYTPRTCTIPTVSESYEYNPEDALSVFDECITPSITSLLYKEAVLFADLFIKQEQHPSQSHEAPNSYTPHGIILGEYNDFLRTYLVAHPWNDLLETRKENIISILKTLAELKEYQLTEDSTLIFWKQFSVFISKLVIPSSQIFYNVMAQTMEEHIKEKLPPAISFLTHR